MASDTLKDIFSGRLSGSTSSERRTEADGSQDLFNSQASSQLHTGIDITLQLTENVWVQCDNPDCQKWRKIPVNSAVNLEDTPWYCSMNPDPRVSSCPAPEEDHAQYDRMAKQAGIKFVLSMLQAGSLVWAKMAGYCSWPAMVTLDPDLGVFVWLDMDGDPCSYHIEFLGTPHTHSWVAAKQIEVYGHKKIYNGLDGDSQKSTGNKKKSERGKVRKWFHTSKPKLRSRFKNMHIDTVIAEADFLMKFEPKQRLEYSVFKPKPKIVNAKITTEKKSLNSTCKTCGQHKKDGTSKTHGVRTKRGVKQSCRTNQKKTKLEKSTMSSEESDNGVDVSVDEGISDPTIKSEPGSSAYGFDSPDQLSQSKLLFQNPLTDKTKEEKFSIDINMYRKNEQAFEHDVRRFMTRNGLKIRSTPVWNNVPIKLFQMFLAVYERGGYYKVTEKKKWTAVYRELTENHHVSSGNVAKLYYQKNLLPYELYIKGKNFAPALTRQRSGRKPVLSTNKEVGKPVKPQEKGAKQAPADKTLESVQNLSNKEPKMFDDSQSKSSSEDIDNLLGKLEEEYHAVISDPDGPGRSRHAIGIKFHDDKTESSDLKYGNAALEFHKTDKPDEKEAAEEEMNLKDAEDKILHELKALEDDLKEMNEDLENM